MNTDRFLLEMEIKEIKHTPFLQMSGGGTVEERRGVLYIHREKQKMVFADKG